MAWHNEGVTVGGEHEVTHVQPDEKKNIYIYVLFICIHHTDHPNEGK